LSGIRTVSAPGAAGTAEGDKVGLYLYNSNEYSEGVYATFKMRAVPVNVNYRYLEDELAYLIDNSDAEALIVNRLGGARQHAIVPIDECYRLVGLVTSVTTNWSPVVVQVRPPGEDVAVYPVMSPPPSVKPPLSPSPPSPRCSRICSTTA